MSGTAADGDALRAMIREVLADLLPGTFTAAVGNGAGSASNRAAPVGNGAASAAVPPERLPEFTARFSDILHKHGTEGAYYGHASVGCLHIRPVLNRKDPE